MMALTISSLASCCFSVALSISVTWMNSMDKTVAVSNNHRPSDANLTAKAIMSRVKGITRLTEIQLQTMPYRISPKTSL
jgi:hypothetical protein